jgi:hypothetical protein
MERIEHMASLANLKLVAAHKPTQLCPIQGRRNKLAKRIWEQAQLAKAQQGGAAFAPTKLRTVVDHDTGARKQVETHKRVKPWWFTAENGKLGLSVRYGSRVLELAKGKFSVEIASDKELVPTLELLKGAALSGELDAAIDAASDKLRAGFKR